MFTGIVSAVGTVIEVGPHRLGIDHRSTVQKLTIGGSVAVNGCCLTVIKKSPTAFFADVVPETLSRTNLGTVKGTSPVNLELPLTVSGLLDGHLVQGHVDTTARVQRVTRVAAGREIVIHLPSELKKFVVEKGSIAVDGVSLTVAAVDDTSSTFTVAVIPHTLAATIAGNYKRGSVVNLEADVVARYVARNRRR